MEIKRMALVLVDISGYTRFMKLHTMSLLHAEAIITELLESVIDRTEFPLTLTKLEGDAAFLYAILDGDDRAAARDIVGQVTGFFDAFRAKERALIACDACVCDACSQVGRLKLKAFLHAGQAAIKKIRQFEELAGEDVILIHRLLKNAIPASEYIVFTAPFQELSGGLPGRTPETRIEPCEGIGDITVNVYYESSDEALPPRPAPGPPRPGTDYYALASRLNRYANRRILARRAARAFSHLPSVTLGPLDLFSYYVLGLGGNIVASVKHRLTGKPSAGKR